MNIALWVAQGLLAAMFLMAGSTKALTYEKAKASMPWVKDYSTGFVKFIGWAEILGALGLVLPAAFGIVPILTPVAAIGIALIMLFATVFHARRKENQAIGMNVIMLLVAAFIVVGRLAIETL
ncbi:DoxX family protein [Cohnella pontilimi]|uniref:DoxX family protein n=1 Tax=Cohnella pontilimi TaxID=2564100 RepID=A0A4U0FAA1_9BACL|nr:DoxX family protein [Cohnella pontilimi]TJY41064.1 DoxX family protein [Cohnella pontilimi]